MKVVESIAEVREWVGRRRAKGETIGFVPTLGYLHAGHESLLERAAQESDALILSIFVNPLQFGPGEDFERYPRDLEHDLAIAEAHGVGLVFTPSTREMYPEGEPWVVVDPVRGADRLCGASRPGHFRGVLTVVAKLFGIVAPDVAVFGRKDFQQLVLIRRMVHDLNLPIRIVGAPIIREEDGLALSSRNSYLSADERRRALRLSGALRACREMFAAGERSRAVLEARLREIDADGVQFEYGEIVEPDSLERSDPVGPDSVAAVAARVGKTRLIDNMTLGGPS